MDKIKKSNILENHKKLPFFSPTEINKTFLIKVSGLRDGIRYNTLVGCTGLIGIIGYDLYRKFVIRAFRLDKKYKEVCKLRTGLKVEFDYK